MSEIIIPCEQCNTSTEFVFDTEMKIKLFWCRSCNHTMKPIGRERLIKPSFCPASQDATTE